MAMVENETAMDEQLAYLGENLQTAEKVVIKLLKYFIQCSGLSASTAVR